MSDDVVVWLRGVHEHAERVALAAAEVDPPPWSPALDREGEAYGNVTASPGGSRAYLEGALWNDEGAESLAMEPVTAVFVAENHPGAVLARVEAERAILAVVLAWPHTFVDGDTWFSCSQSVDPSTLAGEQVPGDGCADETRAGKPCDCGLAGRQRAVLLPLVSGWKHMPGFLEGWTS